nr:MAG TPA: hypothetical protein [Caudoviricetes sp.]
MILYLQLAGIITVLSSSLYILLNQKYSLVILLT